MSKSKSRISLGIDPLIEGINAFALAKKGLGPIRSFAFLVKEQGEVKGGIKGVEMYGGLYIEIFHLEEALRNQGLGSCLVQKAWEHGLDWGATFSTVATTDFEALPFYQALGYEIEFERRGYHKDTTLYFLIKKF